VMTAVLVMQCRDDGLLDLDDRIGRHVPETGYADATVRSLLAHVSGMQSEPVGPWWERAPGVCVETLLAANDGSGAVFAPGEQWHYSNLGFGLLGEAVARLRGAPWFDLVEQRILAPLGMTRTSYLPEEPYARGLSVHHLANTLTPEPLQDTGAMAPAGQLWSTVEDLARFAVVATLVGSPFRMLQMGAGYTLLPRLRAATSPQARWRLIRHEALAVALIGGAGGVILLSAAPWIAEHLLAGKYELSTGLMLAALVSGVAKLADAIATTMVWALANARQLAMLNWVSWVCAAIGVALGWLGARWGLLGLMYGVTAAWICRGAVSGALAVTLLGREPTTGALEPEPVAGVPT